jgi:hypothetical protein
VAADGAGELPVGGDESSVFLVDTDMRFSADRLRHVLAAKLARTGLPAAQLPTAIAACLSRVLFVRVENSAALAAALAAVPNLYVTVPDLRLVAIDSIGAFAHTDRSAGGELPTQQEAAQAAVADAVAALLHPHPSGAPPSWPLPPLAPSLSYFLHSSLGHRSQGHPVTTAGSDMTHHSQPRGWHAVAVVVTKPALYGVGADGWPVHREYLSKTWAALVNRRVVLQGRHGRCSLRTALPGPVSRPRAFVVGDGGVAEGP